MVNFSNITLTSYEELCYLLDKGYPKKSALTFVANHHKYSESERIILNRVTLPRRLVEQINQNMITDPCKVSSQVICIDAYNLYTTFQSLIDNEPVLLCRDGVFRDIFSILHVKSELKFQDEMVVKFLLSIFELRPQYVFLYFDRQRSKSGIHSLKFQRILDEYKFPGKCIVTKTVDQYLKAQTNGIVFSHDSIILSEALASFDFIKWYVVKYHLISQIIDRFFNHQVGIEK
jgi:hypothetical protein